MDRLTRRNSYEHTNQCLQRGELESRIMPLDETLAIMRTLDRIRAEMGVRYANDAQ